MSGRSGVSDRTLGLQRRWFTGEQWADGTAERESCRELEQKYWEYKRARRRTYKTGEADWRKREKLS